MILKPNEMGIKEITLVTHTHTHTQSLSHTPLKKIRSEESTFCGFPH